VSNQLSKSEFIAMMAMLFAVIAFSIDSMLPALPRIGQELSPDAPNRAQLIITSFVIGMGIATFFVGSISDAYGRKPLILGGVALYILGAGLAWAAPSLELMLLARVVQGIGSSGPRVVAAAIVRDMYAGREMARIISLVTLVFMLVPAAAPLLGQGIISVAGWRGIFAAFVIFALVASFWITFRLPETLRPEARRPVRLTLMFDGLMQMLRHRTVLLSLLAQMGCYAVLFIAISLVQPVFDVVFGRGDQFPLWFAAMALVGVISSVMNASLVMRFGMRRLAMTAFGVQVVLASIMSAIWISGLRGDAMFHVYFVWQCTLFLQTGFTIGNLNAIAMEPMGHIAGMAASVVGSVSTLGGALMAVPVVLAFNGTPLPLSIGVGAASAVAWILLMWMRRYEG